jgi:hypothetical protein
MKKLIIPLIVLNILDIITTFICLELGGLEGNPLMDKVISVSWVLVLLIKALPLIVIAMCARKQTKFIFWLLLITNILYIIPVASNAVGIGILVKYNRLGLPI